MATPRIGGSEIRQLNRGDILGELWETRHIDLSENEGKIILPPALEQTTDTTIDPGGAIFGNLRAILQIGTQVKGGGYCGVFAIEDEPNGWARRVEDPKDNFNTFESSGALDEVPSRPDDAVMFDDTLVVSYSDETDPYTNYGIGIWSVSVIDTDWWDDLTGSPSLRQSDPKIMEVYSGESNDILYVTDGPRCHAYVGDKTSGTFYTVEFNEQMNASCIKLGLGKVWIGTVSRYTETAFVYEWDGASTTVTREYPVGARAVLAMEVVNGVPYIITEKGEIKKFNGAGFTTIANLPFTLEKEVARNGGIAPRNISDDVCKRPVHPKGMRYKNGKLYIYTNFEKPDQDTPDPVDDVCLSRTYAGIWVCNPTNGSVSHLNSIQPRMYRTSPILLTDDDQTRFILGGLTEEFETAGEKPGVAGVWTEDYDATNYGVLTTVEIHSNSVEDVFDVVYLKGNLYGGTVTMKTRTYKKYKTPVTAHITWTGTNTFTTTYDISSVEVGEEIDVIYGTGHGRLAHITNIAEDGGTYTVTIDENIGVDTETANIRIDNWKKQGTWSEGYVNKQGIGDTAHKVQLKFYLVGNGIEIDQILLHTNTKQSV